jgi:PAS domain S-box-containing protein
VLLDYYLPDEDGIQILAKIKSQNPLLPVIIVTGRGDEQIAVQAMKIGASDYLVKTMNLSYFDLLLDAVEKTIADRQMKGKIYELEHQYQSIAESVNDLIYRYTPDYTITYVSPSVTKILGYTPQELIYTSYLEILSDHPMNCICAEVHEEQMQGAEIEPFVHEVAKKDGSKVQLETHETVLKSDMGEIIGVQGVARDVTDRKRLEQRLLHSEKLAVIGQMAAHIAHEIRNPLSTINLNLSLLADEIEAYPKTDIQETESLLDSIQAEVEWMMQILDDYLRYARLPEINLQLEDLNEIVANLCGFLESEIERASVQLELD